MAEVNENATFLIAISWQALKRAEEFDYRTIDCNCTIVILFAYLFIEANLSQIIKVMGKYTEMSKFVKNPYPGLRLKLGWFYNEFIARDKVETKEQLFKRGLSPNFIGNSLASINFINLEMMWLMV